MIEFKESELTITLKGDDARKFKELIRNAEVDQLDYQDKEFAEDMRRTLDIDPHYSVRSYGW